MTNKVFPLGPWIPDKAAMEHQGCTKAKNVLPSPSGYSPFKEFGEVTTALTAYPRGALQVRDETDAVYQYCGDATKLYRNVSDTWTDSSKIGGYSTASSDGWEFVPWYNTIIATNFTDNPQTLDLGTSTFADLTTAVKFKHVAVVRDFVVAGYTQDSTDGVVPWRVRWCAFQNPTDWTVSASTLADYEDLSQRKIQRVFGGEYGVVFQDESITRMTFVGAPLVFQFDEVQPSIGLIAPGAAVRAGDVIFFLSSKGFFSLTDGAQLTPIGLDTVDRTVLLDIDRTYLHRITAVSDPERQRVFWGYPGSGSSDGQPNKIICYDYGRGRWSEIEQVHELLWESSSSATTLEALDALYGDLDAMDITLDSLTFIGGARQIAMFNSSYKSGFFNGANRTGVIETAEFMFSGDARAKIHGFRPMVNGTDITLTGRIGTRNNHADDPAYSDQLTPNTGGRIPCRANGRYHRFEITISGNWDQAFAIMVDGKDIGSGGRRG